MHFIDAKSRLMQTKRGVYFSERIFIVIGLLPRLIGISIVHTCRYNSKLDTSVKAKKGSSHQTGHVMLGRNCTGEL